MWIIDDESNNIDVLRQPSLYFNYNLVFSLAHSFRYWRWSHWRQSIIIRTIPMYGDAKCRFSHRHREKILRLFSLPLLYVSFILFKNTNTKTTSTWAENINNGFRGFGRFGNKTQTKQCELSFCNLYLFISQKTSCGLIISHCVWSIWFFNLYKCNGFFRGSSFLFMFRRRLSNTTVRA